MRRRRTPAFRCLALSLLCAFSVEGTAQQAQRNEDARQVTELRLQLQAFEDSWNRGDIAGVIGQYHPSVLIVVKEERWEYARQVEYIADLMRIEPRARLQFDIDFIWPLGEVHAVVNGSFRLTSRDGSGESGRFMAIWMRVGEKWQCVYAHS